jgi:hypothetical protein
MTKLLTVDGVEIEFEKQDPGHACKWCIYVRLKKNDKEQTLLMLRTDEKPFTRFTHNSGKMVCISDEALNEIFVNSINVSSIIKNLEKNTNGKKN